jgi:hypothetical protein
MPNLSVTLPESGQSVTRPVIFEIIKQVEEITKIDVSSKVFFPGETQRMQTPGTSIDSTNERFAIFNTDRITFVEVEEDYDKEALATTAITRQEHIPIFHDQSLRVKVTPIYAKTLVTINFTYRCPSKTEAERWRADMRIRISQMRDINLHDITYHYPIPLEYLLILKMIYDKRESVEAYGQSFQEYVYSMSNQRLKLISDLVGKDTRIVVPETQTRIVGMFDFDGLPNKIERDENNGVYTIAFSYKFEYEKPIGCNMKYPVMIHNQLLPANMIEFTNDAYDLDKVNKSFPLSLYAMNSFETDTVMNGAVNTNYVLRLPDYDDFRLNQFHAGTGSVFIALCEVDQDKKTLCNLRELGDVALDEDILKFIQDSEYPYLSKLYQSILHVDLYRNEFLTDIRTLTVNSQLDISAVQPLDFRNQHRIRFSIVCDLTLLSKSAIDRLKLYPKAFVKIIAAINELLKNHPDFVNLGNKNRITALDFNAVYQALTGFPLNNGTVINQNQYYGNFGNIFAGIDPRLLENYRKNRINLNSVQINQIMVQR